MDVKIVAITKPTIEGIHNTEEFVAYAARVSNPANQLNTETSGKLLKYLIKNGHWSPFEMVHIVIEINSTREIIRQILRHRSFSFQEFSQRYAKADQLGFTISEARLQDHKNRQASVDTLDEDLQMWWKDAQEQIIKITSDVYQQALDRGIAKEVARKPLPEGLVNSRIYMAGSLRSWIHYIMVRKDISTQKEHRIIPIAILDVLATEFPSIVEFIKEHNGQ